MIKSSFAVAAMATLLGAMPVMAAPIVSVGNDTNGSNTPRTTDPNSTAAKTAWLGTFSALSRRTGDLSTATIVSNEVAISFGFGLTAKVSSSSTPTLNTTATSNGHYTAPGVGGPYILASVETLTFTFNQQLSAFGFFATDMGDLPSTMTLKRGTTTIPGGNAIAVTCATVGCTPVNPATQLPVNSATQNGAISFIGVTDKTDWFDTIVFDITTTGTDAIGISGITVGVPEPAPIGLLGAGILALGVVARKSRKTGEAAYELAMA